VCNVVIQNCSVVDLEFICSIGVIERLEMLHGGLLK